LLRYNGIVTHEAQKVKRKTKRKGEKRWIIRNLMKRQRMSGGSITEDGVPKTKIRCANITAIIGKEEP
jgi:hypothetical protein